MTLVEGAHTFRLRTVYALEAAVARRPQTHHLKSITDLDPHCHTLLAVAPLAILGIRTRNGAMTTYAVGGPAGFLSGTSDTEVPLPAPALPEVDDGAPIGLLALVPGYRETLRINGRLRTGDRPRIQVHEAFLHCAKAVIRSHLWDDPAATEVLASADGDRAVNLSDPAATALLAASPFVVLSSVDGNGEADVSPKGDPAGFVRVLDSRTLALPDRPGNHRTDTMHNLLEDPHLGLLALVPGSDSVLEVSGQAMITTDPALRADMAVKEQVPKAAIVLQVDQAHLRTEPALAEAAFWDPSRHVDPATLPRSATIWVDHVKRNTDRGLAARTARRLLSEKLMAKGLDRDYRTNLY